MVYSTYLNTTNLKNMLWCTQPMTIGGKIWFLYVLFLLLYTSLFNNNKCREHTIMYSN